MVVPIVKHNHCCSRAIAFSFLSLKSLPCGQEKLDARTPKRQGARKKNQQEQAFLAFPCVFAPLRLCVRFFVFGSGLSREGMESVKHGSVAICNSPGAIARSVDRICTPFPGKQYKCHALDACWHVDTDMLPFKHGTAIEVVNAPAGTSIGKSMPQRITEKHYFWT